MVFHPSPALILFGLIRVILGAVFAVGLLYLLIKLARLADAMTEAKRASAQSAGAQTQPASGTA